MASFCSPNELFYFILLCFLLRKLEVMPLVSQDCGQSIGSECAHIPASHPGVRIGVGSGNGRKSDCSLPRLSGASKAAWRWIWKAGTADKLSSISGFVRTERANLCLSDSCPNGAFCIIDIFLQHYQGMVWLFALCQLLKSQLVVQNIRTVSLFWPV